jgi:hypothetical protein
MKHMTDSQEKAILFIQQSIDERQLKQIHRSFKL